MDQASVKKIVNRASFLALAYSLIMELSYWIHVWILNRIDPSLVEGPALDAFYILSVILAFFATWLFRGKKFKADLTQSKRSMTLPLFLKFTVLMLACQPIFSLVSVLLESAFNFFGFTLMEGIDSATETSYTWVLFLYASFLAPIFEEITFRGGVMGELKDLGRVYAIVMSSILFGLMHGNLTQSIFATFVAVIFGFVALEYSLIYAILLHIANNFVYGDLLSYVLAPLDFETQDLIYTAINLVCLILAIYWIHRDWDKILAYWDRHQAPQEYYQWGMTTIFFILNLVYFFFYSLNWISPL